MYDLKVGFTCNNNCIHCVVATKRDVFPEDLTTEQIKDIIINKVLPLKEDTVILTGGEASIRKDFVELLRFINSQGLKIHLQTNCTGFADESIAAAAAPYLTSVLAALHSYKESIHNLIVNDRTNTMYKKTIQGINNLRKYNIPFETQTVISSLNYYTLYDTYKFIQNNWPGIPMHVTYPHSLGNAALYREAVCMRYSDMKNELHRIFRDFGKYLVTEAIPFCYLYPYEKAIGYNLDENLLQDFFAGHRKGLDPSNKNLDSPLIDSDGYSKNYSENDLRSRKKGPLCKECSFYSKCPGVWKEYFEMYKHELDLFPIKVPVTFGPASISLREGACENICTFCGGGKGNKGNTPQQDLDNCKNLIDNFAAEGKQQLEISGEPSNHPYLLDVLEYAKSKGFSYIQVSTNGRLLINKDFVRLLKEAGMTHCRIPLYGSTEEIHSKIVTPRLPGNPFKEACIAIKTCADEGVTICAHTVLHQYNKSDLKNILKLYDQLTKGNMKEFVLGQVGISEVNFEYTGNWFLPAKDCGSYVSAFLNDPELDSYAYPIKVIGVPYCTIGRYDNRLMNLYEAPDIGTKTSVGTSASKINPKIPHYNERIRIDICEKCCLKADCDGYLKNDEALFGHAGLKSVICEEN